MRFLIRKINSEEDGDIMKLVLASSSKFKSEILNKVYLKHEIFNNDFDEDSVTKKDVYDYVKELSYKKAKNIENKVNNSIILGLDTVVYTENKIIEKPKTIEEARNNITLCKNNITKVITGITLINQINRKIITDYQETIVSLRDIDEIDIDYYINNEPDVMYASGFIIETIMSNFIDEICGSYYNILGVPVEKIYEYLRSWNIHLKDLD